MKRSLSITVFLFTLWSALPAAAQHHPSSIRLEKNLNNGWRTIAHSTNQHMYDNFVQADYNVVTWKTVDVPHNWDDYGGYRRLLNGNRYGYAWYRRTFSIKKLRKNQRCFLWFEGVGSYATVWVNGQKVGYHAGGRTTFTIDITDAVRPGASNLLCVRADHPKHIRDLPWVSGGDAKEIGFSEGSQPMGIFRPVHLFVTNQTRIVPFGVHIWNDTTVSGKSATLYLETTLKNYNIRAKTQTVTVKNILKDHSGKTVAQVQSKVPLSPGKAKAVKQQFKNIRNPRLWSPKSPYRYSVITQIIKNDQCIDQTTTPYGIRWISWPVNRVGENKQLLVNGKPVYLNGVCGYEHLFGQSHAFSAAQIKTRVRQAEAAGFNAFRDAHQPHNLRFQKQWAKDGILWWPQFAAHIWFDNPKFKEHFKQLLHDWVIERRNNPAVILWGLENESTLPSEFAKECTEIIRELDPTASIQRPVTTCNGGTGTDWNVPQNWSGTYGGDPYNYANEVQKEKLIGEYGAWRSIDLHSEKDFKADNTSSENRMSQLLELKVRLADSVKDKFCGQFLWLLHSHDNPGRVQSGEGLRALDRIGPVNYKGLFTIWGEPVDAFYMYRSNYVSNKEHAMVYIVSHTWPDRWKEPGIKSNITIYSNCDKVALFNDINAAPLGVKTRNGVGTHFQWNQVNIRYNVLYAVGYVDGKPVATDCIVLNHLPEAPHFTALVDSTNVLHDSVGLNYLYRVNCGGGNYKDHSGNIWQADRPLSQKNTWGSVSWTTHYSGLPPFYGSQRRTFDPIKGTPDWNLFQTYRYGRHDLKYVFPVPNGDYIVELYFIEPWFGIGGGINCQGWRLFDVAVNNKTMLRNLDIWKEAGTNHALKKTLKVHVTAGQIVLSFPKVNSVQAVISAIAVATADETIRPASPSPLLIKDLTVSEKEQADKWHIRTWLDTGKPLYSDDKATIYSLPSELYGSTWIQAPKSITTINKKNLAKFQVSADADIYIGVDSRQSGKPAWLSGYDSTDTYIENDRGKRFVLFHKRYSKGDIVTIGSPAPDEKINSYFIAGKYATDMMPTYDLKPTTHYPVTKAILKGKHLHLMHKDDKEYVIFSRPQETDTLQFKVKIGIAGKYAIRVRYSNPQKETKYLQLQIASEGGILLQSTRLTFPPTEPGKRRNIMTMTDTPINAGNYKIHLIPTDKPVNGLMVSEIAIQ